MRIRTPKKNKSDILKTYLQSETDLTPKINKEVFNRFFEILEKNISMSGYELNVLLNYQM